MAQARETSSLLRCLHCGTELPVAARFCFSCGQPVPSSPPGTLAGFASPQTYTPRHLAEKILNSRSALEGERKQVTVLFADVKGSMDLAQAVDPEVWHQIMDRFFTILSDGVHRFEGTINQYTGDGIMALFGAPIAHEDHASRACYAALRLSQDLHQYADELRRSLELSFSVRMGLNSGEVVVGRIGDDLRMDYTAQGHTTGLAARIEQLAEPGRAYLTEHTAALVEGFFRLRDLGPFQLKGVREQLRVYELEGTGPMRTRLDLARSRGFSRFVGRDGEMSKLEAALERATRGEGAVIGIVAEAGIGKSRLCHEFAERCRARAVSLYRGQGAAHGKFIPFLPVLEMFRGYFGIAERDDAQTAREKIAGRLLLLDGEFRDTLPLWFDFLGVGDPAHPLPRMDPEARQRQLFELVRKLLHGRSQREPAVILFEDLHWIDGGTEAYVENLVEAVPGSRILLLVNFRPEYQGRWMEAKIYEPIDLHPLGSTAISELLRDLLGTDPSLTDLADRIRERTAGNPFFIEEVVQSLVEAGALQGPRGSRRLVRSIDEAAIPPTVHALLSARIDRLGERAKGVLQTAAVIGKEFSEALLARVAELPDPDLASALSDLVSAEFLYEKALFPEREYAFKHPLTQEVAYRSQLKEQRTRKHAAVARTIAELYPDKLNELAALVAHHWEAAGDLFLAAQCHQLAAEWARVNNLTEAFRHWHKMRELLDSLPDSRETAWLGFVARSQILNVGWRVGISEDEASQVFDQGIALARRSGDDGAVGLILSAYAIVRAFAGKVEEALRLSREAVALADSSFDAEVRLVPRISLIYALLATGHLAEALRCTEETIGLTRGDPNLGGTILGQSPSAYLHWFRGMLLGIMGRGDESAREVAHAAELARQHGEMEVLGLTHVSSVFIAERNDDPPAALAHAREAVEIAERIGSPFARIQAYWALGHAFLLGEQWSDAVRAFEQTLAISRERRTALAEEPSFLADLAHACIGTGDLHRARSLADEAIALAQSLGTRFYAIDAFFALGKVLMHAEGAGAHQAIEAALRRALELVEETGAGSYEPLIRIELAELARLTGDETSRRRELGEAQRAFQETGAFARAEKLARERDPLG